MNTQTLHTLSKIHATALAIACLSFVVSEQSAKSFVNFLELVAALSLLTVVVLTPFAIIAARRLFQEMSRWRYFYTLFVAITILFLGLVTLVITVLSTFDPPSGF